MGFGKFNATQQFSLVFFAYIVLPIVLQVNRSDDLRKVGFKPLTELRQIFGGQRPHLIFQFLHTHGSKLPPADPFVNNNSM